MKEFIGVRKPKGLIEIDTISELCESYTYNT
jgi:hypothetical protein